MTFRNKLRAALESGPLGTDSMARICGVTPKQARQNVYVLVSEGKLKRVETDGAVEYALDRWPEKSAKARRPKSKKRRDGVTAAQAKRINRGGKKPRKQRQPGTALVVVRSPVTFTQRAPHVEQTLADMRARRQQLDTAIAALETL